MIYFKPKNNYKRQPQGKFFLQTLRKIVKLFAGAIYTKYVKCLLYRYKQIWLICLKKPINTAMQLHKGFTASEKKGFIIIRPSGGLPGQAMTLRAPPGVKTPSANQVNNPLFNLSAFPNIIFNIIQIGVCRGQPSFYGPVPPFIFRVIA